jgi:hypothetical protein
VAREGFKNRLIDFDNREMKQRCLTWFGRQTGVWKLTAEPKKNTRNVRQNAYWHSCVVRPFFDYAREQGQPEFVEDDDAHYYLAAMILGVESVPNPLTGEELYRRPKPTHTLSHDEFWDFVDRARHWLWDTYAILTDDPNPDYAAKREAVRQ